MKLATWKIDIQEIDFTTGRTRTLCREYLHNWKPTTGYILRALAGHGTADAAWGTISAQRISTAHNGGKSFSLYLEAPADLYCIAYFDKVSD